MVFGVGPYALYKSERGYPLKDHLTIPHKLLSRDERGISKENHFKPKREYKGRSARAGSTRIANHWVIPEESVTPIFLLFKEKKCILWEKGT